MEEVLSRDLKGEFRMSKSTQIIQRLCERVEPIFPKDQIDAILFGSYARGDAGPDSDMDVLMLVDAPRETISERNWQIGELAADLLMEYGVVVSPIVENRRYFQENADLIPLFRNIRREGVRFHA